MAGRLEHYASLIVWLGVGWHCSAAICYSPVGSDSNFLHNWKRRFELISPTFNRSLPAFSIQDKIRLLTPSGCCVIKRHWRMRTLQRRLNGCSANPVTFREKSNKYAQCDRPSAKMTIISPEIFGIVLDLLFYV